MIKWLVVIFVVWFVYFYFIKKKPVSEKKHNSKNKSDNDANDMLQCDTCKTYCEIDEMILSGSKYYCSKECMENA